MEVAARDNKPGVVISQHQPFSSQQFSAYFAAFHPGIAGADEAADTGNAVAFSVQANPGISAANDRFSVEGADNGAGITVNGSGQISAFQVYPGGTGQGADAGDPLAGGGNLYGTGQAAEDPTPTTLMPLADR